MEVKLKSESVECDECDEPLDLSMRGIFVSLHAYKFCIDNSVSELLLNSGAFGED